MSLIKKIVNQQIAPWTKYKLESNLRHPNSHAQAISTKNKRKVFILDLPEHNNLGDRAIAVSEIHFLKNRADKYNYDLETFDCSEFVDNLSWYLRNITSRDVIVCQGGGNLGDQYLFYEDIRRTIIHEFPNNKIIIFPQTYFFNNNKQGKKQEGLTEKIYNSHTNLTVLAREKISYQKMKEHFYNCKVELVPDMVLKYPFDGQVEKKNPNKAIICMRDDSEKAINNDTREQIQRNLKSMGYEVEYTDTVLPEDKKYLGYDYKISKALVDNKIRQLSSAQLVITDRLHGMVLTSLSSTNCIIFNNYNYKVRGVYDWLKYNNGLVMFDETMDFNKVVQELDAIHYTYDKNIYNDQFLKIEKLIFTD
ncbi:polysaccharide pyruvyl transferase family protein [Limosilactobacillus mucosae]|uniref:polysaccharide pyruvyl transferase family protein n=1 Tax=Limosilactobacillus mucosae TaxID=97478 RepID=UPI00233EF044|nr:polysaccharide pyruvyl transferase family protein [Limosilactobacillus mucosae]MDC2839298.1 polysaccharide pyruvyl transferase family protein [Limosilactobacillus mucosae]